jgi:hypothetical protein
MPVSAARTRAQLRQSALEAAHITAIGLQGLLDIATSVMPENRDTEEAVGDLLAGVVMAMELSGFRPDETQRGKLYRAIVEYIGEDQSRRLGGASAGEAET